MNIIDENNQQTTSPIGNSHDVTKANSCTIVITDPPSGLDLGIDCMHYETGPNFKGFCQVPEGLHFIYHSTGMGARQGFFLDCRKGEIIILRWDKSNEEISLEHDLPDGALLALHQEICRGGLDKYLGPYPYSQLHLWNNVSGLITHRVLERADCATGSLLYPEDAEDITKQLKTQKEMKMQAVVPHFVGLARVARFVNIREVDSELKKLQRSPSDKTSYCLEKSELDCNISCVSTLPCVSEVDDANSVAIAYNTLYQTKSSSRNKFLRSSSLPLNTFWLFLALSCTGDVNSNFFKINVSRR